MKNIFKRFLCAAAVALSCAFAGTVAYARPCTAHVEIPRGCVDTLLRERPTLYVAMDRSVTPGTVGNAWFAVGGWTLEDRYGKCYIVLGYDDETPGCPNFLKSDSMVSTGIRIGYSRRALLGILQLVPYALNLDFANITTVDGAGVPAAAAPAVVPAAAAPAAPRRITPNAFRTMRQTRLIVPAPPKRPNPNMFEPMHRK